MPNVPAANSMRKALVSPLKNTLPMREKKKALRPKAASGNAVAVPRWCGQFRADVLTDAAKAMQPPRPERYEKKHISATEPEALSYDARKGKYPIPSRNEPTMTAGRGPLLSTSKPTGTPIEYIPRLPNRPIRLLCVCDRCSLSAN
jgi:hypothetical protein